MVLDPKGDYYRQVLLYNLSAQYNMVLDPKGDHYRQVPLYDLSALPASISYNSHTQW